MRFDWYAASIEAKPKAVVLGLFDSLECNDHEELKPRNGYENARALIRDGEKVASVQWGGNGGLPFAWSSGEHAPRFAESVRKCWRHRVSRVDVCEDFSDATAWPSLSKQLLSVADGHRVNVDHAGDHHRGERGRTLMAGSRKSVAMVRLYEKGKQLGQDPNWVRAEIEVKPQQKDSKLKLSTAEPNQFWGVSRWARDYYAFMMRAEIEAIQAGTIFKQSDYDRRVVWMIKQYGKTLAEMLEKSGTACALGNVLEQKLRENKLIN